MKQLALTLVFLFPLVSFAQTAPTNADILIRINVLEVQVLSLQHALDSLIASEASSTPVFESIESTTSNIPLEDCQGHLHPLVGTKAHIWCSIVPEI